MHGMEQTISLLAGWFQTGLISQSTVFFSHNKSASAGLISLETNQRTGYVLPTSYCENLYLLQ